MIAGPMHDGIWPTSLPVFATMRDYNMSMDAAAAMALLHPFEWNGTNTLAIQELFSVEYSLLRVKCDNLIQSLHINIMKT